MGEEEKVAKADAKAAKARANELRPFYKKKRWLLVGGIGVVIIAAAAGGSGKTNETSQGAAKPASADESSSNEISQGIGANDASGDIISLDCGQADVLGFRTPKVTVKNKSSKPSDYTIKIVAETADGQTRYDDTILTITALNPGQTTAADGLPMTADIPAGAVCKVSEVERTASL